jgi:hypothetical protein
MPMKIELLGDSIVVSGWRGRKFRVYAHDVTEVSVMADKIIPDTMWERLRNYLSGDEPAQVLRAIIMRADERAVTLDAYYDDGFGAAGEWFNENGWDMRAAIAEAVEVPLVRIRVQRCEGSV